MKPPRRRRHGSKPPRGPADPATAQRWRYQQRVEALELENRELRGALREIVGWYDSFDQPGGAEPDLTDADFERYRRLARYSLQIAEGRRVG